MLTANLPLVDDEGSDLRARIASLAAQIRQFDHIDWEATAERVPERAARLWTDYGRLQHHLAELRDDLATHQDRHELEHACAHAERLADGHAVLARELEGWSPEMAAKLAAFAQDEIGFSPDELATIHDPRVVKMLHKAMASHEHTKAGGLEAMPIAPETADFASFEKLADARLKGR